VNEAKIAAIQSAILRVSTSALAVVLTAVMMPCETSR
jgi:hypothetical protein